jgi:hypothetical protein
VVPPVGTPAAMVGKIIDGLGLTPRSPGSTAGP